MGELIRGCINPIIKKQLLQGIDQSCRQDTKGDPLCSAFRYQLEDLPTCQSYEDLKEPMQRKNIEPKPLTDYQKHMSVCLVKPGESFYGCIDKWKTGQKMTEEYSGSGMSKTK